MSQSNKSENWESRLGVILAVAGSAVGLANFLRFPGQAAQYGGGAFMIAYFISLVLLAIPIAWAEWTMGRLGGQHGFNTCPGVFSLICKNKYAKYLGILGVLVPVVIYTYYSYIEAWCLGYAYNFLMGNLSFSSVDEATGFWANYIGVFKDGSAISFDSHSVGTFFVIVFILNFAIVYKGISKGIEKFCKYALPTLFVIALIILIRVLTLGTPDANHPENSVNSGLGFMWNPNKVILQEKLADKWVDVKELIGKEALAQQTVVISQDPEKYRLKELSLFKQLQRPRLWLAAASQVFFSLSVGFGIVLTYASYMKRDDDVVLSSLCASSANEFSEVALGGLITLPAAYAFLGLSGLAGLSIFDLGFKTLPLVFSKMNNLELLGFTLPLGNFFGFLFFSLLFLAAVTSVVSTIQPGIAFLEETLNVGRKGSVAILGMFTILGCSFVFYFSQDLKALDTLDFWASNFLMYIIATIQIIMFGWVIGVEKGFEETHVGAAFKIPKPFYFITKYISPAILITVFAMWLLLDVFGIGGTGIDSHILDLVGSKTHPVSRVAWLSVGNILGLGIFMALIVSGVSRYKHKNNKK